MDFFFVVPSRFWQMKNNAMTICTTSTYKMNKMCCNAIVDVVDVVVVDNHEY